MEQPRKILFYCQHSLGIGHLIRSFRLIESLSKHFDITLLSGGDFPMGLTIPSDLQFIQLPAIGVGKDGNLKTIKEQLTLPEIMSKRRRLMLQTFKNCQPDIFMTEYFPFGKFQFTGELIPILRLCKQSSKKIELICSLRDILEPTHINQRMFQDLSLSLINKYYDRILVHGDATVIPLEATYSKVKALKVPIEYTGYVTKIKVKEGVNHQQYNKVVLSIGGGKVGSEIIDKLIHIFEQYGFGQGITLKIIAGPNFPPEKWLALAQRSIEIPNLEVETYVEDLVMEWQKARLSISMGGYNTLLELVSNKIPALIIPFESESNSEQGIRTKKFAKLGLVKILNIKAEEEESIAKEIQASLNFTPATFLIATNGGEQTLNILQTKKDSKQDQEIVTGYCEHF